MKNGWKEEELVEVMVVAVREKKSQREEELTEPMVAAVKREEQLERRLSAALGSNSQREELTGAMVAKV